jgi:hypothetical protein
VNVFEQGTQTDEREDGEQVVENDHGGLLFLKSPVANANLCQTRSQRKPANCCSMASSMRWMYFARGYSAPQPVQRKTTARHARSSARGLPQRAQAGFSVMGWLLSQA